ncbi:MAG: tRNA pseudouridine(55) synthase TruB [Bacilli bacterium]|nr:tRNA pseudouridine(55) synthase TruB [Bacilli bacterium]
MDGVLLINKQKGITSRNVCDQVSKILETKKVGHIGTLDPFATGLLIVLVGKATKCLQYFDDFAKTYTATIKLGEKTSTMDTEGNIIEQKETPYLSREDIEDVLSSFLGKQKQLPPMTSAIHVNGTKLYKLAHQGIEVERPLRDIEIFDIKLIDFSDEEITFKATVSKGTYIRVLGNDIAERLKTVGHLSSLNRDEIGPFSLKEAVSVGEFDSNSLHNIVDVLSRFCAVLKVDEQKAKDIMDGKIKEIDGDYKGDKLFIIDINNNPIAMYNRINEKFIFSRGLF